jgi:enoyl-[acyl-carrier protein] reductase III
MVLDLPLKGKVALVTGGSRGIGRAVFHGLAKDCADVVIGYLRNEDAAVETARAVRKLGRRAMLFRGDLKDTEEIGEMFSAIRKEYGCLDILVHSAALGAFKPLLNFTPVQLRRTIEINAISFIICVQEAQKLMKRGGRVIGISSLGSQRYVKGYGAIGISKACLEAAIRYLAVELAPKGIRVNGISAGPIETEGLKAFPYYRKGKAEVIERTPAGRMGTPEDIVEIVLFLSRSATWLLGQTIVADGGLSLGIISIMR